MATEVDKDWTRDGEFKPRRTRPGSGRRKSDSFRRRDASVTESSTTSPSNSLSGAYTPRPHTPSFGLNDVAAPTDGRRTSGDRIDYTPRPRANSATLDDHHKATAPVAGGSGNIATAQFSHGVGHSSSSYDGGYHLTVPSYDTAYSAVTIKKATSSAMDASMTPLSQRHPAAGPVPISATQAGAVVHVCYAGLSKTMPLRPSELNMRGVRSLFLAAFPNYVDTSMLSAPFGAIYMQLPGSDDKVPLINPRAITSETLLELRELHPSFNGPAHHSSNQLSSVVAQQPSSNRLVPRSGSSASTPGDLNMGSYQPASDARQSARTSTDPPWTHTPNSSLGRQSSGKQRSSQFHSEFPANSSGSYQPKGASGHRPGPNPGNVQVHSSTNVPPAHRHQSIASDGSTQSQAVHQRSSSSEVLSRNQHFGSAEGVHAGNAHHRQGSNDVFIAPEHGSAAGENTVRDLQQKVSRLTAMVAVFQAQNDTGQQQEDAVQHQQQQQQHQQQQQQQQQQQSSGMSRHRWSQTSSGSQASQLSHGAAPASSNHVQRSSTTSPAPHNLAPRLLQAHSAIRSVKNDIDQVTLLHLNIVKEQKKWFHAIRSQVTLAVSTAVVGQETAEVHLPEEIQRRAQKVERRQELSGKAKDYQTRCAEVSQEISDLYSMVDGMRVDVGEHHCQVDAVELDAIDAALNTALRKMTALRDEVGELTSELKPIMKSELEVIVTEEKFVSKWPVDVLGEYVDDCQKLLQTVSALKEHSTKTLSPRAPAVFAASCDTTGSHQDLMDSIQAIVPNHDVRQQSTDIAQQVYQKRKQLAKDHKLRSFQTALQDARNHLQQTDNDIMVEKRQRRALYNIFMKEKEAPRPVAAQQNAMMRKPTQQQHQAVQQRVLNSQAGAPSHVYHQSSFSHGQGNMMGGNMTAAQANIAGVPHGGSNGPVNGSQLHQYPASNGRMGNGQVHHGNPHQQPHQQQQQQSHQQQQQQQQQWSSQHTAQNQQGHYPPPPPPQQQQNHYNGDLQQHQQSGMTNISSMQFNSSSDMLNNVHVSNTSLDDGYFSRKSTMPPADKKRHVPAAGAPQQHLLQHQQPYISASGTSTALSQSLRSTPQPHMAPAPPHQPQSHIANGPSSGHVTNHYPRGQAGARPNGPAGDAGRFPQVQQHGGISGNHQPLVPPAGGQSSQFQSMV